MTEKKEEPIIAQTIKFAKIKGIEKPMQQEIPLSDDGISLFRKWAISTYNKLSEIYSSPYPSAADERIQAIKLLDEEFTKGLNPEYVIFKMKQLSKITEFKSKLAPLIIDRFWDKSFVKGVEYKPFDINKNL